MLPVKDSRRAITEFHSFSGGQCPRERVSPRDNHFSRPANDLQTVQYALPSHHMITNVVFNVTSELMILLIPLPLFFRSSLPWKRKFLLVLPFTMAIFTMFAAIICKVEVLLLLSTEWWGVWCCREASMAVIVTNVPYSLGLIRQWTKAGSFLGSSSDKSPTNSPQSSWNDSKQSLLRAAKNDLSLGFGRKQIVASRSTSGRGFSEKAFVTNEQYSDRHPSTAVRYSPNRLDFLYRVPQDSLSRPL